MVLFVLLFVLFGVSHADSDPYCEAVTTVPNIQSVQELVMYDIEPLMFVSPEELKVVGKRSALDRAESNGWSFDVLIEDLESYYASQMSGRGDFGDYYTFAEAIDQMNFLHTTYPTVTTEPESIGVSLEGNILWAMKLSDNPGIDEAEPEVLFTGVHHAREPIGCTLCLDFLELLASTYGSDPLSSFLIDNREIWIIPVVNPDGYLYNEAESPSGGGMWRKNRRNNGDGSFGVDLNRNYPYQWGYDNSGSSPTPSSDTYRGPSAGSELETQAIMEFCENHEFTCAQNWHSYGNYLLYPWGYIDSFTPDNDAFVRLAGEAVQGIAYQTGTAWQLLYNTNGDANDWMYGEQSTKPKIFSLTGEVGESFWQESSIDDHIQEGRQISMAFTRLAGPAADLEGYGVSDDSNGNGRLDPGETADLEADVRNIGFGDSPSVTMNIETSDPYVQIDQSLLFSGSFPSQTTVTTETITVDVDILCPDGHVAVFNVIIDGDFMQTDTLQLTVPVGSVPVLFVDSDDEPTEVRLEEALRSAAVSFDRWDRFSAGSPPLSTLLLYRLVIWSAGDQNTSSVQADDRASLTAFLDAGGALLLSAENYLTAYGSETFTSDYLHIDDYTTSVNISSVSGSSGDPITDGVTMDVDFPGGMSDAADAIEPAGDAAPTLYINGGSSITALRYPVSGSSVYRLFFSATPYEALRSGNTTLPELTNSTVEWLLDSSDDTVPSPCPSAEIIPGGTESEVILSWAPATDNVAVTHYRIYESQDPYFSISPATLAYTTTETSVERDLNTENTGGLFWRITAVDAAWNESDPTPAIGAYLTLLPSIGD